MARERRAWPCVLLSMCVALSTVGHAYCEASVVSEKSRGRGGVAAKEVAGVEASVGVAPHKKKVETHSDADTLRKEVPKHTADTAGSVVKESSSKRSPTTTHTTNDGTGDGGEMTNTSVSDNLSTPRVHRQAVLHTPAFSAIVIFYRLCKSVFVESLRLEILFSLYQDLNVCVCVCVWECVWECVCVCAVLPLSTGFPRIVVQQS